jgi:hypothetical protein
MNLFEQAIDLLMWEIRHQRRRDYSLVDVIDYAYAYRKYLDLKDRGKAIAKARKK